jgi:hypothetical protein
MPFSASSPKKSPDAEPSVSEGIANVIGGFVIAGLVLGFVVIFFDTPAVARLMVYYDYLFCSHPGVSAGRYLDHAKQEAARMERKTEALERDIATWDEDIAKEVERFDAAREEFRRSDESSPAAERASTLVRRLRAEEHVAALADIIRAKTKVREELRLQLQENKDALSRHRLEFVQWQAQRVSLDRERDRRERSEGAVAAAKTYFDAYR